MESSSIPRHFLRPSFSSDPSPSEDSDSVNNGPVFIQIGGGGHQPSVGSYASAAASNFTPPVTQVSAPHPIPPPASPKGALAFDVEYARWCDEHYAQINKLRDAVKLHAGDTELRFIVDNAIERFNGKGALAFDVEYARWLEEHNRMINELRAAVNSHAGETELRIIVDNVIPQFNDIFRLKGTAAKADVFHILSGMWKTPAERCFMWIGGFRPSELLKLLVNQLGPFTEQQKFVNLLQFIVNQLEPFTEQQLVGIYNLQQSSQQAEDALSQGMEVLQQSLAETLPNGTASSSGSTGNVANYMGQMTMAMGKLGHLDGYISQADNLRQQVLEQMHRILTTRQSARTLLAINDYFSNLRALSSLWLARPRE